MLPTPQQRARSSRQPGEPRIRPGVLGPRAYRARTVSFQSGDPTDRPDGLLLCCSLLVASCSILNVRVSFGLVSSIELETCPIVSSVKLDEASRNGLLSREPLIVRAQLNLMVYEIHLGLGFGSPRPASERCRWPKTIGCHCSHSEVALASRECLGQA
jgi:hypothetical protein